MSSTAMPGSFLSPIGSAITSLPSAPRLGPHVPGRLGHIGSLGDLRFRRQMLPEVGDAEDPISPLKRLFQAVRVVEIRLDHLRAQTGKFYRLFRFGFSGERTRAKAVAWLLQDRANQADYALARIRLANTRWRPSRKCRAKKFRPSVSRSATTT